MVVTRITNTAHLTHSLDSAIHVFVIDMSGSMNGHPLDTCKAAMRHTLRYMNPDDTFRIIRFSDEAASFSPVPLANTPENVAAGLAYVDSLSSMGGTNMQSGIRAALQPPRDEQRVRIVLFMTDGYIGNEHEILALIDEIVGDARLFSLGVGSAVNRFLLDEMARVGRGSVHYVDWDDDTEVTVGAFYRHIHNPVLTDVALEWDGVDLLSTESNFTPNRWCGKSKPLKSQG